MIVVYSLLGISFYLLMVGVIVLFIEALQEWAGRHFIKDKESVGEEAKRGGKGVF